MISERIKFLYSDNLIIENHKLINDDRLQDLLIKARLIKRFTGNDLPSEVVQDNVFSHTMRTLLLSEIVNLPEQLLNNVRHTLLIHDLPEVQNLLNIGRDRDVTAPEKELDPDLEEKIAQMELSVARNILTTDEYNLYINFEEAGKFLKTGIYDLEKVTEVAIFAQLFDKIDANLTLHRYISQWFRSAEYDPSKIVPEQSLTFYTRQYQMFSKSLYSVSHLKYLNQFIDLLNLQNKYISSLWES